VEVSAPTIVEAGANLFGQSIDGTLGLGQNYAIREDNVGLLPQNIENMARTLFGSLADTGLQIAYSMSDDSSSDSNFDNFVDTVYSNVAKRLPVVKGVIGKKTSNISFSIPAQIDFAKNAGVEEAMVYFKEYLDPRRYNEDGLSKPVLGDKYTLDKGLMGEETDLPFINPGPQQVEKPLNPLYPIFGEFLQDTIATNEIGMSGLDDRDTQYRKYVKLLRSYNSGDRTAIEEWQQQLSEITDPENENTKEMQELLTGLDLTKYDDRVTLINLIENRRSYIIQQKLEVYRAVEGAMTKSLQEAGIIKKDEEFLLEKHLRPFDTAPVGVTQEQLQSLLNPVVSPVVSQFTVAP